MFILLKMALIHAVNGIFFQPCALGEGWCPRPELNWDQRFRNEFIIFFLFIKSFYAVKIARNCSLFTMLFPPDFISYVCRKNCQFIIVGSGFFIREKNLTELVRRFSVVLLGFPEIPRIQREDDTQTTE
jgi:hypothetical protein